MSLSIQMKDEHGLFLCKHSWKHVPEFDPNAMPAASGSACRGCCVSDFMIAINVCTVCGLSDGDSLMCAG